MNTKERILMIRIIEMAQKQPDFAKALGIQYQLNEARKHSQQ